MARGRGACGPADKGAEAGAAKKVLLVVCGGIAAYKACEVLRALQKAGCEVRVAMTESAERFVGLATFEGLTRTPVLDSLFENPLSDIPHIDYAEWADLALVVPATANVMAKMAHGLADDAASAVLLACPCPVLVAPGMNVHMWRNPATQANVRALEGRGVRFVLPVEGRLACGDMGAGKLADPGDIAATALAVLGGQAPEQDLVCTRLLVTAGPTHEAIDPVRYIANASTGKMGYAIAEAARRRGAEVVLVSGPVSLPCPEGVRRVDVVSAAQMHEASLAEFEGCDAAVCCAAVADYTPAAPADHKLKKAHEHLDAIRLVETADILADLCGRKRGRIVVGFAAETDDLIRNARSKLERKGADAIIANDVSRPDSTFGSSTNRIAVVSRRGVEQHETAPLPEVADVVLDTVRDLLRDRG